MALTVGSTYLHVTNRAEPKIPGSISVTTALMDSPSPRIHAGTMTGSPIFNLLSMIQMIWCFTSCQPSAVRRIYGSRSLSMYSASSAFDVVLHASTDPAVSESTSIISSTVHPECSTLLIIDIINTFCSGEKWVNIISVLSVRISLEEERYQVPVLPSCCCMSGNTT